MSHDEARVAALLRERAECVTAGKKDRVAAIDADLAANGHKPERASAPAAVEQRQVRPQGGRAAKAAKDETDTE